MSVEPSVPPHTRMMAWVFRKKFIAMPCWRTHPMEDRPTNQPINVIRSKSASRAGRLGPVDHLLEPLAHRVDAVVAALVSLRRLVATGGAGQTVAGRGNGPAFNLWNRDLALALEALGEKDNLPLRFHG